MQTIYIDCPNCKRNDQKNQIIMVLENSITVPKRNLNNTFERRYSNICQNLTNTVGRRYSKNRENLKDTFTKKRKSFKKSFSHRENLEKNKYYGQCTYCHTKAITSWSILNKYQIECPYCIIIGRNNIIKMVCGEIDKQKFQLDKGQCFLCKTTIGLYHPI